MSRTLITFLLCAAFLVPAFALAHGDESSFEKPVGTALVDIGYTPTTMVVGESENFDFELRDASSTDTDKLFSQVWVRIVGTDGTILATGLYRQALGPTTMLYSFAKGGQYTLSASYRDGSGNEIAGAEFPITVAGAAAPSNAGYVWYALVFVAGVAVAGLYFSFSKSK